MRKMKKILSMVLAVGLVLGLTACKSGTETAKTETNATESSESGKPVLRVGMEGAYAPFDWLQTDDANGGVLTKSGTYMNGYDIMIAQKICDELGYQLEVDQIAWDGLIPSVQSDKIDCAIAGMSITDERKLSVDFTDAYYVADLVLVTRGDSKYANATSLQDLAGASISANISTLWYDVLEQVKDSMKVQPALENTAAGLSAVSSGKVDAIVMDTPSAMSVMMSHPELKMISFEQGKGFKLTDADKLIGIAVKKGNTELLEKINKVLAGISAEDREKMIKDATTKQPLNE